MSLCVYSFVHSFILSFVEAGKHGNTVDQLNNLLPQRKNSRVEKNKERFHSIPNPLFFQREVNFDPIRSDQIPLLHGICSMTGRRKKK